MPDDCFQINKTRLLLKNHSILRPTIYFTQNALKSLPQIYYLVNDAYFGVWIFWSIGGKKCYIIFLRPTFRLYLSHPRGSNMKNKGINTIIIVLVSFIYGEPLFLV